MAGETILTIVGNLTADPELRTTGTGTQVCGFTIASTPRVWNRQANQYEDGQSLFMRCSAWRDLAGHCAQSPSKGMRVIATGRLSQRSYQAQDGTNRTVVEMTVDEIGPSLRYATAQHIIDCAEVINRLLTYPKDARRAVLYDNLHDSLATFEESAPDYPDPDDDADETDRGEAVDPTTGEIK